MSLGFVASAVGLVLFGYLMGSLSPSVFLGKTLRGVDVREHGSGNAGTTNAFRVLGKRLGVTVLAIDMLKAVIPVVFARCFTVRLSLSSWPLYAWSGIPSRSS